jgi:uncharacterized membrane protein YcjF (UPF0283 family)
MRRGRRGFGRTVSVGEPIEPQPTREALAGELAHQLSLLVRKDLELAAVQRAPELRRLAIEIAAALAAAVALFLTLGALSWAAFQGLAVAFEPWTAALIVAAAWTGVSILAISVDHPRRLLRRLRQQSHEEALSDALVERALAEQALRTTAMELGRELGHEAREQERRMLSAAGHRVVDAAEHDVETLLKEILHLLAAPGRAGINLLEKLIAGADEEPPRQDAARPKRQP